MEEGEGGGEARNGRKGTSSQQMHACTQALCPACMCHRPVGPLWGSSGASGMCIVTPVHRDPSGLILEG